MFPSHLLMPIPDELGSFDEPPEQKPVDKWADSRHAAALEQQPVILMSQVVFCEILHDLSSQPPEAAGILLGPRDHYAVTHYHPDDTGRGTPASFTVDHVQLNEIMPRYLAAGIDAKGIVHSHPAGCTRPSRGDLAYARKWFAADADGIIDEVLMPLVVGRRLYPYVVLRREPEKAQFAQFILF